MRFYNRLLVLLFAAAIAGCSTLARDGPDDGSIQQQASGSIPASEQNVLEYALVDLTRDVTEAFAGPPGGSLFASFGAGRGAAPEIRVGVGDVLQVTVFESDAGGLFVPRDAGARPGNFVTFPAQIIDRVGTLSVPYAGQIQAAGKTIREIQRDIEVRLSNRAIEPQAIVSLVQQRSTDVAVVGDVNQPSKFAINPAGERLLDVISRAGGIRFAGYETFVTLQRGERRATVLFKVLVDNPNENIFVSAGDTLYVYREQRSFLAFGASGLNGFFFFDAERISWAEGVAKAGGLADNRADPAQAFLYRPVKRDTLAKLGVDLSRFPPDRAEIPTIFRANFRQPAMFFLAQKFALGDKDVLYVSNADSVELNKFLSLINNTSAAVANVPSDLATARNAARSLGR